MCGGVWGAWGRHTPAVTHRRTPVAEILNWTSWFPGSDLGADQCALQHHAVALMNR